MIATTFTDWTQQPVDDFQQCSPALRALHATLAGRYGVVSLGCYGRRPIRGTTKLSTHSWGAAIDLSYGQSLWPNARHVVIGYLVGNSAEWGIQAVHDYLGCRIWRAGRTSSTSDACSSWWRAQRPDGTMGASWATYLHVEVSYDGWDDARDELARGVL